MNIEEIKSAYRKVLQEICPGLSLNLDGEFEEKIREMNHFLSEKNYGYNMTKKQICENLGELLTFCYPSMTENKQEEFLEKYLSLSVPSSDNLEDFIRAGFAALILIKQKQH